MKFVVAVVLALVLSAEALYPLPEPVVPSVVYGVPEESKPDVAPIKTEYSYTVPAVEVHHEEPHFEVLPVHPVQPEIHVPTIPTLVEAHNIPHFNHHEYPVYGVPAPSTHLYSPSSFSTHGFVYPHNYGYSFGHSLLPYSYAYSTPHLTSPHQVVYDSSPLTVGLPAPVSTIVTESHDIPEVVHEVVPQHPVVTNYEYHLPQITVAEAPKPFVPQTVYGVPEIPSPVVPHSTYGVPLLK